MKRTTLIIIGLLALVGLACRVSVNVPMDQVTTGQIQVEEINIPAPDASTVDLKINFDAGELKLSPGAESALVEGTAYFNIPDLKPQVEVRGSEVRLSTGAYSIEGIPHMDDPDLENRWELRLGSQRMSLAINAGAYEGQIELGGLALRALFATSGAAKVDLNFSKPNPVEMTTLQYQTGASGSALTGLANANFASMIFRGGAGDYTLDFGGTLQRDANVIVEAGVGQITIAVPDGVPAELIFQGGLTNVDASAEWQQSGNIYTHTGSGPALSITVNMGAGALNLK